MWSNRGQTICQCNGILISIRLYLFNNNKNFFYRFVSLILSYSILPLSLCIYLWIAKLLFIIWIFCACFVSDLFTQCNFCTLMLWICVLWCCIVTLLHDYNNVINMRKSNKETGGSQIDNNHTEIMCTHTIYTLK